MFAQNRTSCLKRAVTRYRAIGYFFFIGLLVVGWKIFAACASPDLKLLRPKHLEVTESAAVVFEWEPVPGAAEYTFSLWKEVGHLVHEVKVQPTPRNLVRCDLDPGTTYRWRVQAIISGGAVLTSEVQRLAVVRPRAIAKPPFRANFHAHSRFSGLSHSFWDPFQFLAHIWNEGQMSVFGMTEHGDVMLESNFNDWNALVEHCAAFNIPGKFAAWPGVEWNMRGDEGHITIITDSLNPLDDQVPPRL